MVGRRTFTGRDPVGSNAHVNNGDLESGQNGGNARFKDAVNLAMADKKKAEITDKLKAGLKQQDFEKYYTPSEKVCFPNGLKMAS